MADLEHLERYLLHHHPPFISIPFIKKRLKGNPDVFLPTEEEKRRVRNIKERLLTYVDVTLANRGIQAKVMAVGSTAKDTFVRGDTDIDIFIVTTQYKEAYEHFQKVIEGYRKEGPMDIWHFILEGFDIDLVFVPPDHPRIDTLFHTEFMNRALTPKQKEEVIRAKAFFKSEGVYGAEIGGIVGIAVEELIRRHDTLDEVCRVLAEADATPFLEDPAMPKRTLLASLKPMRWKQLQSACKRFLDRAFLFSYKPYTLDFYFGERREWSHLTFKRVRDRAVDFHTSLSACNHALRMIKNQEPEIEGTCDAYVLEKVVVSYQIAPRELPKKAVKCGPPLHMKEAVEAFKAVHPSNFEQNGLICTTIEREKTNMSQWMYAEISKRMTEKGYTII